MSQSKVLETTYIINGGDISLKATGSIQIFDGFKKVYNYSEKKEQSQDLPNLKNGDKLNITKVDTMTKFHQTTK